MFVAADTPSAGTIASAETKHGSAEPVRALLIQCASVKCPLTLGILDTRNLIIERLAEDDTVLASATYAVPQSGDRDRALTFNVDVAIYPKASVRARFDLCGGGETQWVLINYDFSNPNG